MIHARPRFCSYSMTPAGDDFVPIQPFGRPGGLFLAQAAALERAESEKDSSDKSPGHGALQGCAGEGRQRGPRRPGCPPEDLGAGGSKPPTCSVDVVAWRVRRASNGAIAPRHAGATASRTCMNSSVPLTSCHRIWTSKWYWGQWPRMRAPRRPRRPPSPLSGMRARCLLHANRRWHRGIIGRRIHRSRRGDDSAMVQ